METLSEFLAGIPRSSGGKRRWPLELKAQIVAETLIEGATVNGVAKRYGLIPSSVSDGQRRSDYPLGRRYPRDPHCRDRGGTVIHPSHGVQIFVPPPSRGLPSNHERELFGTAFCGLIRLSLKRCLRVGFAINRP